MTNVSAQRVNFQRTVWQKDSGEYGGADEGRTRDLLHAMQALSQLSYSPSLQYVFIRKNWGCPNFLQFY